MDILAGIKSTASLHPERIVMQTGPEKLTYGQLWERSGALASFLINEYKESKAPFAVFGHKSPWMLICFLACVRAGHAYCPLDISIPEGRLQDILATLPAGPVFMPVRADRISSGQRSLLDGCGRRILDEESLERLCAEPGDESSVCGSEVTGDETFYIIFTSGSTGRPKGVQISAACLNNFLDWSLTLDKAAGNGAVFLNQAPFSFDLSVMDLYTCLAAGGTLYCLEKSIQSEYRELMHALSESGAQVWVSTPSFADVCLADPSFTQALLPQLECFLFCGETLANKTAKRLLARFPKASVVNTYGPTESTVALTQVRITPEMAEASEPLPVGRVKPGSRIRIADEAGISLPDGEKGEIILLGNTVSTGYFEDPVRTGQSFFADPETGMRGYHTGDCGYLKDGMLYYCGRLDLQIKLHGYRMELEDIEANLCRLPQVRQAVVVPRWRQGKVTGLTGYLVLAPDEIHNENTVQELRLALSGLIPDYMIPKKLVILDRIPMTPNGKADRKALAGKTV